MLVEMKLPRRNIGTAPERVYLVSAPPYSDDAGLHVVGLCGPHAADESEYT
jgi:hypothetical protein